MSNCATVLQVIVGLYPECNAAGLNDAVFLMDKSKIRKYKSSAVSKYSSQFSLIINHQLTKKQGYNQTVYPLKYTRAKLYWGLSWSVTVLITLHKCD